MRRLNISFAVVCASACMAFAAPAAAVPIDPGRLTVSATAPSATGDTLLPTSIDRSVIAAAPSASGDRPADGLTDRAAFTGFHEIDFGGDTSSQAGAAPS